MITGSTSAQDACAQRWPRSSPNGSRGGGTMFSSRASHHQVSHSAAPIIRPGTMPARNSLEIDTLAATPKITKPMLGGMTGPMTPAEAISPAERALSWPAVTIIGSSSVGQRRRIGDRRARQRRQQAGGHDGHVAEAALDVADHRQRQVDDAARQAADVHDLAGQHEEGHGQQRDSCRRRRSGSAPGSAASNMSRCHISATPQTSSANAIGMPIAIAAEQRADEDEDRHACSSRTID